MPWKVLTKGKDRNFRSSLHRFCPIDQEWSPKKPTIKKFSPYSRVKNDLPLFFGLENIKMVIISLLELRRKVNSCNQTWTWISAKYRITIMILARLSDGGYRDHLSQITSYAAAGHLQWSCCVCAGAVLHQKGQKLVPWTWIDTQWCSIFLVLVYPWDMPASGWGVLILDLEPVGGRVSRCQLTQSIARVLPPVSSRLRGAALCRGLPGWLGWVTRSLICKPGHSNADSNTGQDQQR